MIFFILYLDVVGETSCIKLIEFLLHFFENFLFSGHGRSTIINPSTPTCLHFLINLFSSYCTTEL